MNIGQEKAKIFRTKEEEFEALKKELENIREQGKTPEERDVLEKAKEIIKKHSEIPPEEIDESYRMPREEGQAGFKEIEKEPEHQKKIEVLLKIAEERGPWAAFQIEEKVGNPHLTDDFHRELIKKIFAEKQSQ